MKTKSTSANRNKWVKWAGVFVLLGGLGLLALVALIVFRRPLGPGLAAIPSTGPPTTAPIAALAGDVSAVAAPTTSPVPATPTTSSPTSTAPPVAQASTCGETGVWNVLILGVDADSPRGQAGSDLTRAARVDFTNKKADIYAFSRDLWVNASSAGLTNPVVDATELGLVFYASLTRSTQTEQRARLMDATNATARVMAQNFNIQFDHYLVVDLDQLSGMVDTIGGVPINIPARITDPWIGMVIQAGPQTLTGAQAEAYARVIPDTDFARIQRNNLLIEALRQKLLDPAVWVKIPQLYQQFSAAILTDFSPQQIANLACLMKAVPSTSILQDEVKSEWTSPGPVKESLLWDAVKVTARLKELGLTD